MGSFCAAAKPIRLTDQEIATMTLDSLDQVLAHNETGARLCGWKPA